MDIETLKAEIETMETWRATALKTGEETTIPKLKMVMNNLAVYERFPNRQDYLVWRYKSVAALYVNYPLDLIDPVKGIFRKLNKIIVWINHDQWMMTGDIVCQYSWVEGEPEYIHKEISENLFIPGKWERLVDEKYPEAVAVIDKAIKKTLITRVEELKKQLLWDKRGSL